MVKQTRVRFYIQRCNKCRGLFATNARVYVDAIHCPYCDSSNEASFLESHEIEVQSNI